MRQVKGDPGLSRRGRKFRLTFGSVRELHFRRSNTYILRQDVSHGCTTDDEAGSVSFKMKSVGTLYLVYRQHVAKGTDFFRLSHQMHSPDVNLFRYEF